jgi:hypothetical protein
MIVDREINPPLLLLLLLLSSYRGPGTGQEFSAKQDLFVADIARGSSCAL